MHRVIIILAVALMLFAAERAEAFTGIGIGARGGAYTHYDNGDLEFEGYPIIEIDQLSMFGGHIRISTLPIFTYELVAEYSWKSDDYVLETGHTATLKIRDFMLGGNVKYKFKIPTLRPYIGGGLGLHQLTYELEVQGGGADGFSIAMPDDGPRMGFHALAGLELGIPTSPLEFFLEGRVGRIAGSDKRTNFTMIYGGITLKMF